MMELKTAQAIGQGIIDKLSPYCVEGHILIVGSVRRGRPKVHDVDILALPANESQFYAAVNRYKNVTGGSKILQVRVSGEQVDIYVATMATWPTLLLIRTGSADHNKRLCTLAKSKGMKLCADGSGLLKLGMVPDLFNQDASGDIPIPVETEADIFKVLGVPYKSPSQRE